MIHGRIGSPLPPRTVALVVVAVSPDSLALFAGLSVERGEPRSAAYLAVCDERDCCADEGSHGGDDRTEDGTSRDDHELGNAIEV